MRFATFWANFSQAHLVTLVVTDITKNTHHFFPFCAEQKIQCI
jgi:hypothetical protein